MQTLIEKITAQLVEHENKSVEEFNAVFDENETLRKSLSDAEHVLMVQNEAITKQAKSESNLKLSLDDLKKQSVAFQLENKTLMHQIIAMRKEARAQREQVKRNKAANTTLKARVERLQKTKAADGTNTISNLTCIYSVGDDALFVFPNPLTIGVDGTVDKQVILLYTNHSGCFVSVFLDSNDEVGASTFINKDSDIADRTKELIKKNTMQISDTAAEYAEQWLIRVNRHQRGRVNDIDLVCMKG